LLGEHPQVGEDEIVGEVRKEAVSLGVRLIGLEPTIVHYREETSPFNAFPQRIVSPSSWSSCCRTRMERLGGWRREKEWFSKKR
jgi:hypothetical protein